MSDGYTVFSALFLFELHINLQLSQKHTHKNKKGESTYKGLFLILNLTRNHAFNLIAPRVLGLIGQLS